MTKENEQLLKLAKKLRNRADEYHKKSDEQTDPARQIPYLTIGTTLMIVANEILDVIEV
jgi:hypothetical protein